MKVCFVIPDMSIGGSSTVVHDLIYNWTNDDELHLVVFYDRFDDKYVDLFAFKNLVIHFMHRSKTIDFKFIKFLSKKIREINPDIISSHLTATFYLSLVGAANICPIVHTIHSEPSFDLPKIYRIFLKRLIKNKKILLVGCCEYISKKAMDLYKSNCYTITNSVNIQSVVFPKKVNDGQTTFLFIGRLSKVKNINRLVEGFSLMQNKESKLLICGDGEELNNIKATIEKKSLSNRVELLGKVSDVKRFYLMSDVLCLVSHREGMPIVVIEGIHYGLAFIATNVGGVSEFVNDGENGFFVNGSDPYDIANKMDLLCSSVTLNKFKLSSRHMAKISSMDETTKKYKNFFLYIEGANV